MTRDEAIEIEKRKLSKYIISDPRMVRTIAEASIDALIELGILKISEPPKPPTVWDKLWRVIKADQYDAGSFQLIEKWLDEAGLELVENKNDE